MQKFKIAIADDHKIFRKGLVFSLRHYSDLEFVFEAEDGADLIKKLDSTLPDVILMDLKMPNVDGIEATKIVKKKFPSVAIICLTMMDDERFVFHLMDNGANGYLLKNSEPEEIRKAIIEVKKQGYYLNDFTRKAILKRKPNTNSSVPKLNNQAEMSSKEKSVLELICMEFTSKEIGDKLNISPRSVETVKERLMERFGAKNVVGLVFYAIKNNII
jgi:DNA-binding NarL/FixJ family response regulator